MDRELYKDIDFKKNFRKYLALASKYKWMYIGVIILAGIVEAIGLLDRYLFKLILDNGTEYSAGTLARAEFVNILLVIAGVYALALILRIVFGNFLKNKLAQTLEFNMILDIKRKFFNHIVDLSHRFHTTHKTGSLIARLNRGTGAVESLTDFVIGSIAPLILQLAMASALLFFLDKASAVIVLCTAILFIVWGIYMANKRKPAHIAYNYAEDREKGALADVLMNIESIKYYGKERSIKQKYTNLAMNSRNKLTDFGNQNIKFSIGHGIILGIGTFFLIYFPVNGFLAGEITLGTLSFIYTTYLGLMGPLFNFVGGVRRYYRSIGEFDNLFQYEEIENEIKDPSNAKKLEIKKGEVEFKNVSFQYYERGILRDISLKIKPGEKIALVGHSGSGKTTFVKLLYRLYDVQEGEILVDGKNIRDYKQESLRSELSIVPQEAILFDDSIYNNIQFSNPQATRAEVFKAMKFAQLDKFVAMLPQKENTIVGERGVKLSGGEKQRVSIARAILANKKVLVLDEATSSLDSQTEYEIQKALAKLMEGRTSIIIAHRLSTIMKADKIVVMDKGKIVQTGRHEDLIKEQGIYKQLWNLQKGGYLKE